jgi:FkbM family methyltransferase
LTFGAANAGKDPMHPIPIDYERLVQDVYEAVLRPGDTAMDIGANVGRHTMPMVRSVGPAGRILAVEPLAECRAELRRRLPSECPDSLATVQIVPFALSDRAGPGSLIVAENNLALSGLRRVPYPAPTPTSARPIELETLDRLVGRMTALHYIKLDAEGAELHILRGGTACLERFRPVVGFEFGTFSNREFGVEPADMARFWAERDYHVYAITGQQLREADFIRCAWTRDIWDYVAVPGENAALNQLVSRVLNWPRVNWLAVRAQLNHAQDHAEVGAAVPPLRCFRGPLWPMARGAARLFLMAARMITIPQRLFNQAVLLAFQQLTADLEETERESQRQDRRVQDLQRRLEELEGEIARLRAEDEQQWERVAEHDGDDPRSAVLAEE